MEQVEFNVVAGTDPLIEEKYGHPVDLLDAFTLYYPEYSEKLKVNNFHYVGKGADAYVFNIGDQVYKFTQNKAHAKAAYQIALDGCTKPNLVDVYGVVHLPLIGMYLIIEQYLHEVPGDKVRAVELYFNPNLGITECDETDQLDQMIISLTALGISGWDKDCFTEHNILYDPYLDQLKLFDFGYTECKNRTEIPEPI